MVLRRDRDLPGAQIFYRLVPAAVTELQLESPAADGESENLVTEANAKDRFFAQQSPQRFVRVRHCRGIAGTVREENAVRI